MPVVGDGLFTLDIQNTKNKSISETPTSTTFEEGTAIHLPFDIVQFSLPLGPEKEKC